LGIHDGKGQTVRVHSNHKNALNLMRLTQGLGKVPRGRGTKFAIKPGGGVLHQKDLGV